MEVEFEGKKYIVPGCCPVLVREADKKEPHCAGRFSCKFLGECNWAAEGRTGRHLVDIFPEARRTG